MNDNRSTRPEWPRLNVAILSISLRIILLRLQNGIALEDYVDHIAIALAKMTLKPVRDGRLINSLLRGVEVLSLLSRADGPLGVTDVAEKLAVDPSTAYRLLATLERG